MSESNNKPFEGFEKPKANFSKLPHQLISELHRFSSLAELKVVLYTLRHTWGYDDDYKKITHDEFENGRKDKDGNRLDEGIGMTKPSIIDGIKRAIANGFLYVYTDTSDTARVKKFYSLTEQGLKSFTPEVKEFYPRGKDSLHRTEKETIERNIEKEITPLNPPSGESEAAKDDDTPISALDDMKQAVKQHLKQYGKQQENVAMILLGVAKGKNAKFNIEGKMTPETLAEFVLWWDTNKKDRNGQPLTRPRNIDSVKNNVQAWLDDVVSKRKAKPLAANGHKPVEGRYVDKSATGVTSDEYRKQYGLPDVTQSEVPDFLKEST